MSVERGHIRARTGPMIWALGHMPSTLRSVAVSPLLRGRRTVVQGLSVLRAAFKAALSHDCLNLAQSASYSAMIALFPALIVAAAVVALLPSAEPLRQPMAELFRRVLPATVLPLVRTYFAGNGSTPHHLHVLLLAVVVSVTGASSVIASLMDGISRSLELPSDTWSFAQKRIRALLLVPASMVPLLLASLLVVFGQMLATLLAARLSPGLQPLFLIAAQWIRWAVALSGVTGVTALILHFGAPLRAHWRSALPGALAATILWFLTTLLFGWYVTRFANYREVYGSLGAGIALLLWLNIVFLSVLCGAEVNGQLLSRRQTTPYRTATRSAVGGR